MPSSPLRHDKKSLQKNSAWTRFAIAGGNIPSPLTVAAAVATEMTEARVEIITVDEKNIVEYRVEFWEFTLLGRVGPV